MKKFKHLVAKQGTGLAELRLSLEKVREASKLAEETQSALHIVEVLGRSPGFRTELGRGSRGIRVSKRRSYSAVLWKTIFMVQEQAAPPSRISQLHQHAEGTKSLGVVPGELGPTRDQLGRSRQERGVGPIGESMHDDRYPFGGYGQAHHQRRMADPFF